MSEADTRSVFLRLAAPLDPHPIENLIVTEKGMPDVEYMGGWAELKWLPKWPVRASTIVSIKHYTDEQRAWLLRRWNFGEGAWLVLQSREEWFFWSAPRAQHVGTLTREDLITTADYYHKSKPSSETVCSILVKNKDSRIGLGY